MKWLMVAAIAAQAADIGTTCTALRTGHYAEANPLLPQTCGKIAVVKGTLTAASLGAVVWLERNGHKKGATIGVLGIAASGSIAAGLNLRLVW